MSTSGTVITRTKRLAAAIETTTGTAATLDATKALFNGYDFEIKADIKLKKRPLAGSLTKRVGVPQARMGTVSFKTELYNDATTPQWLSVLLLACGWAVNTGVYSPLTGSVTTITIGIYQGASQFKQLTGCMGTFKIVAEEAGSPIMIEWTFTGIWAAPTTVSMITPTYPAAKPPRFANATISLGSYSGLSLNKFELDMGNKVIMRPDAENTNGTGYAGAFIVDRDITATMDPAATSLSTRDFYAGHVAMTTYNFSLAVGSGTNGVITIAAPALQLEDVPEDGDRDGEQAENLKFGATSETSDGELTITPS